MVTVSLGRVDWIECAWKLKGGYTTRITVRDGDGTVLATTDSHRLHQTEDSNDAATEAFASRDPKILCAAPGRYDVSIPVRDFYQVEGPSGGTTVSLQELQSADWTLNFATSGSL